MTVPALLVRTVASALTWSMATVVTAPALASLVTSVRIILTSVWWTVPACLASVMTPMVTISACVRRLTVARTAPDRTLVY